MKLLCQKRSATNTRRRGSPSLTPAAPGSERQATYGSGNPQVGLVAGFALVAVEETRAQATPPDGLISREALLSDEAVEAAYRVELQDYGPWRDYWRDQVDAALDAALASTQPSDGRISVELDRVEVESLLARVGESDHIGEGFEALCPTCNAVAKLRAALTHNPQGAEN